MANLKPVARLQHSPAHVIGAELARITRNVQFAVNDVRAAGLVDYGAAAITNHEIAGHILGKRSVAGNVQNTKTATTNRHPVMEIQHGAATDEVAATSLVDRATRHIEYAFATVATDDRPIGNVNFAVAQIVCAVGG